MGACGGGQRTISRTGGGPSVLTVCMFHAFPQRCWCVVMSGCLLLVRGDGVCAPRDLLAGIRHLQSIALLGKIAPSDFDSESFFFLSAAPLVFPGRTNRN